MVGSGWRAAGGGAGAAAEEAREVAVALDDMKFSAAHFVAYKGFREPLHGHNYTVGLRAGGPGLQADGYLADFGDLKRAARKSCKQLNQRTLLPMRSDVLQVRRPEGSPGHVEVRCEGGAIFRLPEQDCALLPVMHTTAEELAEYLWWDILVAQGLAGLLLERGVEWVEVSVAERPGQGARYRCAVRRAAGAAAGAEPPAGHEGKGRPTPRPCSAREDAELVDVDDAESIGAAAGLLRPTALSLNVGAPEQNDVAEAAFRSLLGTLGIEESSRPALARTPYRAAKAFRELTSGLSVADPAEVVGHGLFDVDEARDLVAIRDIPFHSLCEHHLLPFSGIAHVAYFPEGKVLGLSKFPRLLHVYARRLQLQERLTAQFAEVLQGLLQPRALAVAMEATHACMCARGIGVNATTRTLALRGSDQAILKDDLLSGVSFAARARL